MNAVEIEAAVSALALQPYDGLSFRLPSWLPLAIKRQQSTAAQGRVERLGPAGGVLQRNNIHISTCESGRVGEALKALRLSPKNAAAKQSSSWPQMARRWRPKTLPAARRSPQTTRTSPDTSAFSCPWPASPPSRRSKTNPIDVRATGRLNKLYIELQKENPEWATEARRHDMNHFMARLNFLLFAEDTDIFNGVGLFTRNCPEQMSAARLFQHARSHQYAVRAMNIRTPTAQPQICRAGPIPFPTSTAACFPANPMCALHPHGADVSAARR